MSTESDPDPQPITPAWSLTAANAGELPASPPWPGSVTREWAFGGSTGRDTRVCILDSGVDRSHPDVGGMTAALHARIDPDGTEHVEDDDAGDQVGHGTACAGIVRTLAPDCELTSVRVLDRDARGRGRVLAAGLRWAVQQDFDVISMSLSTAKREVATLLHDLVDEAYFRRTLIVASAHNMPIKSYPWRYAAVISVGSHEGRDPYELYWNPQPPVEFFAHGVDVTIATPGGKRLRATGNSFATAHVSGLCALIRAKHPWLIPYQVKWILQQTASNGHRAE
jgi:subtilisin family serine protease